jgi:hypothetical protein
MGGTVGASRRGVFGAGASFGVTKREGQKDFFLAPYVSFLILKQDRETQTPFSFGLRGAVLINFNGGSELHPEESTEKYLKVGLELCHRIGRRNYIQPMVGAFWTKALGSGEEPLISQVIGLGIAFQAGLRSSILIYPQYSRYKDGYTAGCTVGLVNWN